MPAVAMFHETPPKDALIEKVGDISDIEIFANDVLVAIYERPIKTKSGIYMTDNTRGEDLYQGKIALIIAMGPMAFQDSTDVVFREESRCKLGDWVFFRPADGWQCTLTNNRVPLRIIQDINIRGRVASPDSIY